VAEWTWLWGILIAAAISAIGWLYVRSVKLDAHEAIETHEHDCPLLEQVAELQHEMTMMKLDLARNYVQHSDLREIKRDSKALLRKLTSIQIALAKHLRVTIEEPQGDNGDEA
jgi:hypothetical protein